MVTDLYRHAFRTKLEHLIDVFVPQIADDAAIRDAEARIGRSLDILEREALLETRRDARPRELLVQSRARKRPAP